MKTLAPEVEEDGVTPDQFTPHLRAAPSAKCPFRADRSEAVLIIE